MYDSLNYLVRAHLDPSPCETDDDKSHRLHAILTQHEAATAHYIDQILVMPKRRAQFEVFQEAQIPLCWCCVILAECVMPTSAQLVLQSEPGCLCSYGSSLILGIIDPRKSMHVGSSDIVAARPDAFPARLLDLTSKLLEHGADPNDRWYAGATGWQYLVHYLDEGADLAASDHKPQARDPIPWAVWYQRSIQALIKVFIAHGADLGAKMNFTDRGRRYTCEFDTASAVLEHWLPMDAESEWPELLRMYASEEKQAELKDKRRELIRGWGECWLSDEDRELLGLPPRFGYIDEEYQVEDGSEWEEKSAEESGDNLGADHGEDHGEERGEESEEESGEGSEDETGSSRWEQRGPEESTPYQAAILGWLTSKARTGTVTRLDRADQNQGYHTPR
jgi:hypothetical protein